jgi:DNA-binding PadR family transcriptional regulator
MLQGTLDMLVLKTRVMGPAHGHTIAHIIEQASEEFLQVEQGSLYPALHRLEDRGWLSSFWERAKTTASRHIITYQCALAIYHYLKSMRRLRVLAI